MLNTLSHKTNLHTNNIIMKQKIDISILSLNSNHRVHLKIQAVMNLHNISIYFTICIF